MFISYSPRDQKLAVGLAGWMHELFGIESFIDSCVWGYADDLLKIIDDNYCITKHGENGNTYNYLKWNQSTMHIHLIMNTALQKMIDKTECLIFLNTPNSLLVDDVISGSATASHGYTVSLRSPVWFGKENYLNTDPIYLMMRSLNFRNSA